MTRRAKPDGVAISAALFHLAVSYGIDRQLETDEQVAIAKRLAALPAWPTPADIEAAFRHFRVKAPPAGYAAAVIKRLRRLAA